MQTRHIAVGLQQRSDAVRSLIILYAASNVRHSWLSRCRLRSQDIILEASLGTAGFLNVSRYADDI